MTGLKFQYKLFIDPFKILVFAFALLAVVPVFCQDNDVEKIQKELITAVSDTSRAKLLNDAAFLLRGNNPKLSLQYANLAMELSVKADYNTGKLNSYLIKGIIYKRLGNYEKAMQYYTYALQISELLDDKSRISSCYNNIGSIYQAQGNYSKAVDYFNKSLEIEKSLDKKEQVSIRLYNLGTVYEALNKLDTAYSFYNQSLAIEEVLKNEEGISFALYGLGGVLTKKGNFLKAEGFLNKAYNLAKTSNDISGMSYCLHELGMLYVKWRKINLAIENFQLSISYADSLQEKSQIKETYYHLASAYAQQSKYKEAYECFEKYNKLNEELNDSEISRKITEINTKYEVDKMDKELELIRKEGRIRELEIKQQQNLVNYLIFTSIIVIALAFFRYNRKRNDGKSSHMNIFKWDTKDALLKIEKMIFSKKAWAIMLSLYIVIYIAFVQPFGLAFLDWVEKWSIIAVYGALSIAATLLSYVLFKQFNEYFRKKSFLIRYFFLAVLNILILTFALYLYNGFQELNNFDFVSLTKVLFQVVIISFLPVLLLVVFSERISYKDNLKDIPLEAIVQQQNDEIIEVESENKIIINTDNVGGVLQFYQSQIICFEANDNYTAIFFLKEGHLKKELYRITLKKVELQLFDVKEFVRCHKSYIINISFLRRISGNAQGFKMHLNHLDFEIPVSRSFPRQIIDKLKEITPKSS